jgi:hypothetical protein
MTEIVIGQHAGHHGLAHRNSANADARVMASFGDDIGFLAETVHGSTGRQY